MKKFTFFSLILLFFIVNTNIFVYASENNFLSQEEINTILQSEDKKYILYEQEELFLQNLDEILCLNELELEGKLKELELDEVIHINDKEPIINEKSSREFYPLGAFSADFIDKSVVNNPANGDATFSVTLFAINLSPCTIRQLAGNVTYRFESTPGMWLSYDKFIDTRFIYPSTERRIERISYLHTGLGAKYIGNFVIVTKEYGTTVLKPFEENK